MSRCVSERAMRWLMLGLFFIGELASAHVLGASIHFTEPPAFEPSADGAKMSIVARNIVSDCDPIGGCPSGGFVGGTTVQLWAFTKAPPARNPGSSIPFDIGQGYPLAFTSYIGFDPATGRSNARSDFGTYTPLRRVLTIWRRSYSDLAQREA